jgi:hypothetical protein
VLDLRVRDFTRHDIEDNHRLWLRGINDGHDVR